jgi:hypothetical protein
MLRFLATGSAGTDGSCTGRAWRGLVLSRRNERRAEERRYDKSRDCKFGSHEKRLRRLQDATPIGRVLRRSYVRTVADVWKVTERRTKRKAAFERNSYSGVAWHEQGFPRYPRPSPRHACRALRICSTHDRPPHPAAKK